MEPTTGSTAVKPSTKLRLAWIKASQTENPAHRVEQKLNAIAAALVVTLEDIEECKATGL